MTTRRVLPSRSGWPLHTVAATRALEQQALAALPAGALMQRAGLASARCAAAVAPHAHRIAVFAGPGNNGGDGIEAARQLRRMGRAVDLLLFADAERLPPDALLALERARADGVVPRIVTAADALVEGDWGLAIDALLGIGASRAPDGLLAAAIGACNRLGCQTLALDVPSGLDADTGQPLGAACVRAAHTLSLLTLKPGLFTGQGRDHAGSVWFDGLDLGADALQAGTTAWLAGPPDVYQRPRPHASHKGSFGNVVVVGGARGMVGAPLLAARAALAAGAGRVYVSLLEGEAITHDVERPELMFRNGVWNEGALLAQAIVVCGCGGGAAVARVLQQVLATAGRLVLDADALTALAHDPMLRDLLHHREARARGTVLTPHPLEAARLLECETAAVQADRLGAAVRIAERYRCTVVLKGSGTVIAGPGCRTRVNPTGNASLASAGTGDVLAGWLGGLWGGMAASADADVDTDAEAAHASGARAAAAAVWLHGAAADAAGMRVLPAADLVDHLARLI